MKPQVLVYEPSVAEHPDEDVNHHSQENLLLPTTGVPPPMVVLPLTPRDMPLADSGWEVVQSTSDGKAGAVYEVGPLKTLDSVDSAV